jgi:ankyrin repeat protein
VKLLLQAEGIDINSKDDDAWTALAYALLYGNVAAARLLLAAGAIDERETSTPTDPVQLDIPTAHQTEDQFRLSVD